MKSLHFLLLSGLLAGLPAYGREVSLRLAGHEIHAEVAETQAEKERGLMGRKQLCADCGMLFVFDKPDAYAFWMKDTPLPLSIAFIGADGRIINIDEMLPNTLDPHEAKGPASYVLEMSSGWFAAHGVKPGDKVKGLGSSRRNKERHHVPGKR